MGIAHPTLLFLVSAIIQSLQEAAGAKGDRNAAIQQMRGVLKTDQPAPTNAQVEAMLEERQALLWGYRS